MQDHVRSLRILYWGFQCVRNIKNVGSHGEDRLSNWVLYTIFSIGLKSCPRCCTSDAYCSFKWQGADKVSGFYAFEPKFLLAPHSKAGDLIRSVQCQDNSQLPDHHGLMLGFNYPLASWHFLKAALISFNISFILMPFLKEKKKSNTKETLRMVKQSQWYQKTCWSQILLFLEMNWNLKTNLIYQKRGQR